MSRDIFPANLTNRLAATLKSAAKVTGAQWIRVHRQAERELELVSTSAVTDEELREDFGRIAIIEETQLRIRDDLGSLPANGEPVIYLVTVTNDDGRELGRDRIRIRAASPSSELATSGPALPPPGSKEWEHSDPRTPTAHVMQQAVLRQQYRHNEALAGSVVKSYAPTMEKMTGLIGTLTGALEASYEARARDAEKMISVQRQERTLAAEARAEEMRGEALKLAAGTFAEYFPVAIHKITRKYGLSGDDAIDPILEKLVLSFKPEQLDGLSSVLTPFQLGVLGDLWCTVKDRVEARTKAKAEAEAKTKAAGEKSLTPETMIATGGKALVAQAIAHGANGANGSGAPA